jgi:hypothetical protein
MSTSSRPRRRNNEEDDTLPPPRRGSRIRNQPNFFAPPTQNKTRKTTNTPRATPLGIAAPILGTPNATIRTNPANAVTPAIADENIYQALFEEDDTVEQANTVEEDRDIWVAFTDGSYTPVDPATRKKLAGWGVVLVKNGGMPGPFEDLGEELIRLYGKVSVKKCKNFLQNK